jgi:ATP-binding cassette subfamily E protein 1
MIYGQPGGYRVVTFTAGVREGINQFLDGFVVSENMKFRDTALQIKVSESAEREDQEKTRSYDYPTITKTLGSFSMEVQEGAFTDSEIVVILGENGTGKTTFVKLLAGKMAPDDGAEIPSLNISYKPQKVSPSFPGSVRQLLHTKIQKAYVHPQFIADVMKPMKISEIIDRDVLTLSGGELQRVALVLCLGKPADVYLIDEPSAYLDAEQRLNAAKVIKRYILQSKKTAFIVEHDFIMGTYMADRVIVFEGEPGVKTYANKPDNLVDGMNLFLKNLEITFRRDPTNYRPRINKMNSQKDVEQKTSGDYFFIEK